MIQSILCIAAVLFLITLAICLKGTIVPKLIKLSGFVCAIMATFMPNYTIVIRNYSFDVSIVNFIFGCNLNVPYGNDTTVVGNIYYVFLFILPVAGILMTIIKDTKLSNIITAVISLVGLFTGCILLFKQIIIRDIVAININIGIVFMFIAYAVTLIISIIRIYATIHKDNNKVPVTPVKIKSENIEAYMRESNKTVCDDCGEENLKSSKFCKKCGKEL